MAAGSRSHGLCCADGAGTLRILHDGDVTGFAGRGGKPAGGCALWLVLFRKFWLTGFAQQMVLRGEFRLIQNHRFRGTKAMVKAMSDVRHASWMCGVAGSEMFKLRWGHEREALSRFRHRRKGPNLPQIVV